MGRRLKKYTNANTTNPWSNTSTPQARRRLSFAGGSLEPGDGGFGRSVHDADDLHVLVVLHRVDERLLNFDLRGV